MKNISRFLKHYLTPHAGNGYRARLLHIDVLTGVLIFAVALSFAVKQTGHSSNVLGYATDISIPKLLELTNVERQKGGLSVVTYNDKLARAASLKADDMFAKNYWAHYSPDGKTPWDFILTADYQYEYAGENLAKNFLFSQGVVDAWMNSPSHRENILRKEYTEVGFAVKNGVLNDEPTTLVVQMFGKPAVGVVTQSDSSPDLAEKSNPAPATQPVVLPPQSAPAQLGLSENAPKVNIFPAIFTINSLFLGVLFIALALDFFLVIRLNLLHTGSKHVAHLIFVGFILLGLLFITKGAII